ncbi:polysaccharide pyruvyl transferase family protein [Curtobacterium sp. VKM Ac-1376]|uniref:polysaccharide pyruvyl transferase family protein n=1 Tax=Curtobacterium sp. VKM Ac-1376 TaxID=123312 RepID=UPI00188DAD9D|nr:polysaccharide pyruvyl transferase family protein [Curtobacterium sp. VKM Ac-1376]MBF4614148.1 polysaccharide pyruvyl transferase family protein [Curtobacterium sp. VKM Ac-1376]
MANRSLGRCLIVNAYSYKNAGDAAIMLSTARLLKDMGASSVSIASRYDDSDAYGEYGLVVVPPIVAFPASSGGSKVFRMGVLLCSSIKAMGTILTGGVLGGSRLRGAYDTLVVAGGGYMYSSKRWLNMSLWHSLLSVRLGVAALDTVLMMPQSIGPIERYLDRVLVEWALKGVQVVVRETKSLEASSQKPDLKGVRVIDDVAFYPGIEVRASIAQVKPILRLVAMDWTWSRSVSASLFDRYVSHMAVLADLAATAGFRVVLGGHSCLGEHDQDDIRVAERIGSLSLSNPSIDANTDVAHLYNEYSDAAAVVGTRLHSCIMALSVGTPAVGLSYQEKTPGVLAGIGHEEFVHPVDDFDPAVVMAQIQALVATPRAYWASSAARTRQTILEKYEAQIR